MTAAETPVLTRGRFGWLLALTVVLAAVLRGVFPLADPPSATTVGIVWHDEGAWTHNARNKALFGRWSEDAWNPVDIAPVFTGLEYASFALFGVGIWQARLVSELAGIASVALLACGVRRIAGREAGLIAGVLLATNYVYVMWNRAALMETSMVAFMVAAWDCYVRAQTQPLWGVLAAACALLAYFTKAAAIFFVAALAVEALLLLLRPPAAQERMGRRAAMATLGGLALCGAIALAVFVVPNWTDYRFYNWQISVTRKPSYDVRSVLDRVTWFPILHDIFTRMWFTVVVAVLGLFAMLGRWRIVPPAERLAGAVGGTRHARAAGARRRQRTPVRVLHSGPRRRRRDRPRTRSTAGSRGARGDARGAAVLAAMPLVFYGLYVVAGPLTRLVALYQPRPGVRFGAAVALLGTVLLYATWPRLPKMLAGRQWSPAAALLLAGVVAAGQLAQFAQWVPTRSYKNYVASVELGTLLPPGTLVHGKLANGLSLENRIKPVFVGRGFGNYADRKQRDDVRYILTYIAPRVGFEGPVIEDVLEAYPNRSIIRTFDVAETATGHDQAALIDKFGGKPGARGHGTASTRVESLPGPISRAHN